MVRLFAVFMIIACTCAQAQEVTDDSASSIDPKLIEGVKSAFAGAVVDPSSTQLRGLRVRRSEDGIYDIVCGDFNSKNRMGGYVGFAPFQYFSKHGSLAFNSSLCP